MTSASQNLNHLMEALFRLAAVCFAAETQEVYVAETAVEAEGRNIRPKLDGLLTIHHSRTDRERHGGLVFVG